VLINSVQSSLTLFMLSFFEMPRGVLKKIDYYIDQGSSDSMINIKRNIG